MQENHYRHLLSSTATCVTPNSLEKNRDGHALKMLRQMIMPTNREKSNTWSKKKTELQVCRAKDILAYMLHLQQQAMMQSQ